MLASLADANTSNRQEAVAADRDLPGKPHRGGVSACVAVVPGSGRGAEYLVHRLHQRQCDAACGELRCQCGAHRNAERVAVAAALGASVLPLADWFDRVYGVREGTLVETCQRLTYNSDGPYQATGTPKSLDHKFITEDVPTGLTPMREIGAAAGVRTPAIDALVEMVRRITGNDFAAEGRTLERLGLSGIDGPQIRRVMDEGFS
jgi:hypothetical protein